MKEEEAEARTELASELIAGMSEAEKKRHGVSSSSSASSMKVRKATPALEAARRARNEATAAADSFQNRAEGGKATAQAESFLARANIATT